MNDQDVEFLFRSLAEECDDIGKRRVKTFADAGVMTLNRGITVGFADGSEFQLTIVQTRNADSEDE